MKRKTHPYGQVFLFMESGNVLLSQSGNRNSRAVRSFAIPAFISLNRPQGALDFDSKYNVGRWLENDLEEGPAGMHKEKAPDIV